MACIVYFLSILVSISIIIELINLQLKQHVLNVKLPQNCILNIRKTVYIILFGVSFVPMLNTIMTLFLTGMLFGHVVDLKTFFKKFYE